MQVDEGSITWTDHLTEKRIPVSVWHRETSGFQEENSTVMRCTYIFVEKKAACILQWRWQHAANCGVALQLCGFIENTLEHELLVEREIQLDSVFSIAPAIISVEKLLSFDESLMLRREPRENLKIRRVSLLKADACVKVRILLSMKREVAGTCFAV